MTITEPMGLHEIAAEFHVAKTTALSWTRTRSFPAPVFELAMGPVWDATHVCLWVAKYRPAALPTPKETA